MGLTPALAPSSLPQTVRPPFSREMKLSRSLWDNQMFHLMGQLWRSTSALVEEGDGNRCGMTRGIKKESRATRRE